MENNRFIKSPSKTEWSQALVTNYDRNSFPNTFSYSNVPYRSNCDMSFDNLELICTNKYEKRTISDYSERICPRDHKDFLIHRTGSDLRSATNLEGSQENNNFYMNAINNRAFLSVDYIHRNQIVTNKYDSRHHCFKSHIKQGVLPQWNINVSHVANSNPKENTFDRKIFTEDKKAELDNKTFLGPQFFKAESILNLNLQKHLTSANMDNKHTIIPTCKPPLSPFTNSVHRNQKFINGKKDEFLKIRGYDNLVERFNMTQSINESKSDIDNYTSSNDGDVSMKENEYDDESDYCEKAEEMDLLDNLDSEIINEEFGENIDGTTEDYESPSEEMLEEVHRLFHSTSFSDAQSPFINSLFPNIPPVIRFVREGESVSLLPLQYQAKLKWKLSSLTPNVVKRAAKRSGFKLINKGTHWSGYFGRHMKVSGFKSILEHQKFNHLPGSFQIGRKDRLWRNVSILASKNGKGKEFNFLPKTYCLPSDIKALKQAWDDEDSMRKARWILKPPASARGIGVKVISKWSQIPKKRPAIVQSYISRPFLINDSKFDLRIYVAVTSCDPLRIYVHKNGLVRFASHKYSKSSKNISNRFIHLTNYSVNKKNENYTSNENHEECQGHKWTLKTLWKHMEEDLHIDWKPIWKNIKDCIVKTIISVESHLNSNIKMYCAQKGCVYELFGFDVLLDNKLKPWVIEVNVSPSLHSNSPLDIEVKSGMIADLFNIVGFQLFHTPEDYSGLQLSQSRRPSLSASSIPSYLANADKTYFRSTERQSSQISINKSTRKVSTGKGNSKFSEKNENKPVELQKTQSNDSLPIVQYSGLTSNSKELTRSIILKRKKLSTSSTSSIDNTSNSNQDIVDPSLYQQTGYYNRTLTPNEKSKHTFYVQKEICENQTLLSTITDKLTIDDARILIESLDEFNRAGDFELTFPTGSRETDTYMSYIYNNTGCRYYNLLLHQFMKKYQTSGTTACDITSPINKLLRPEGVKILEKYSKNVLDNDNVSLWTNPNFKDLSKNKPIFRSTSAATVNISKIKD